MAKDDSPTSARRTPGRVARERGAGLRIGVVVPALVVLGLAVVLGPALVGQGVLLDVNSLSSRLPFRTIAGNLSGTAITCRQDTVDYFPSLVQIRTSLTAGHLPTWAPYEVGGAPFAALPYTGWLSPISLPYFILPLWLAPAFVKLLEITAAISGMIAFLRGRGVSVAGSWLAGFVFVTSGFMIMWSNWPHTRGAALIPLLMWAVDRVVERHRTRDVVVLALVFAAMLLGGFLAVTVYALAVAGVFALVRVRALYPGRLREALGALATALAGLALGLGLAALQMVPFVLNLSAAFADRDKGGRSLPLSAALTLLDPTARGSCVGGQWFGNVIPIEAVGYVGSAAMVLAVIAIGWRRRRFEEAGTRSWLWISVVVIALLIWVGGPLLWVWERIPVIGNNSITRAQSVIGFLLACLAGWGFDRLLSRTRPPADPPATDSSTDSSTDYSTDSSAGAQDGLVNPRSRRPLITLIVAAVALTGVTVFAVLDAQRDDYLAHLSGTLVLPLILLVLAGALAVLVLGGPRRLAAAGCIGLVVLVVAQGALFARTLLPLSDRALLYPQTPTHDFLQARIGADRYGAGDRTMDTAVSDWYHLRTPTGHDFIDPRWKDLLVAVDPDVMRSNTYAAFSPALPFGQMADSEILDRLAVRYWTANPRRASTGDAERVSTQGRVELSAGGEPATCRIPAGPLRGIALRTVEALPAAAPGTTPTLHVRIVDGSQVRTGSVLLDAANPGLIRVAVAGEDLPSGGRARVEVSVSGTDQPRWFSGEGRRVACSPIETDDDTDGVRLVFADSGAAVYERLGALPRIRWADTSRVVSPEQQVATLRSGVPAGTVLLDDAATPAATGGSGSVSVALDASERIVVDTDATAPGYLVVADSLVRAGWTARVDGQVAPLVRGDHALAAVPVPAGRHRVELTYSAPGLRAGAIVSAVSILVAVTLVLLPAILARRRRGPRRAGTP